MFKLIQAALLLLALLSTQTPAATTVRYQHTDILGSVVAETDAAANIISRSHYEPFGKRSAGDKAGISYTGHLQDEDLNLIYMQQRYYDPVIGRFYSNDPIGFRDTHSFNRYVYANNNPYKYIDPTGMECTNTDGETRCVTDDYDVTVKTPEGFPGTDESSDNFHYYIVTAQSPKGAGSTQEWVKNNPTPGNPAPASPGGTLNDATPVIGGISPVEISPVESFTTTNQVTGSPVVVNVTLPGHPLHPGIVVRQVTPNGDGTSTITNYGEGNGWLQKNKWYTPDKTINGVWTTQNPSK